MTSPRVDKRREIHHPADRCRGDFASKVDKVPDEPPWSSEGNVASFWLVHPCTPSDDVSGTWTT